MLKATIETAVQLSKQDAVILEKRFKKLFDEEIDFTYEIKPELIGGFIAYVDGKKYDMSLATKLEETKDSINSSFRQSKETNLDSERITVADVFAEKLGNLNPEVRVSNYGTVISCADGIVEIEGLTSSRYGEILKFENDAYGIALELSSEGVGAVLLSDIAEICAGSLVLGTNRVLDIKVGNDLLGRVIDPLGRPLDGKPLDLNNYRPLENPAPTIMDRAPVNQALQTGILAIDSMIPIGKGQRELIIGDRQMGKSVIALSAILNQSKQKVICVYCAIGQKASTIAKMIETLKTQGDFDNCIVVASTASDSAAMQYITPYAGCAIAEYFMYEKQDVLIVYDDLSKHANSYRTMSLLLKRPPGREAFPGDVFYLHSRLLERAAKLSPAKGGGSLTALPIIETMAGDISAYIPTNVISITDGQVYLENELFNAGIRPAVNVGLSVSRVGRAAQPKALHSISGQLRLRLAQYRELAVFAQFDSDLDINTRRILDRGERLTEILKQDQSTVYRLSEQVAILLAFDKNTFSDIPLKQIGEIKAKLCAFLATSYPLLMETVDRTEELNENSKNIYFSAIAEFNTANELDQERGDELAEYA